MKDQFRVGAKVSVLRECRMICALTGTEVLLDIGEELEVVSNFNDSLVCVRNKSGLECWSSIAYLDISPLEALSRLAESDT